MDTRAPLSLVGLRSVYSVESDRLPRNKEAAADDERVYDNTRSGTARPGRYRRNACSKEQHVDQLLLLHKFALNLAEFAVREANSIHWLWQVQTWPKRPKAYASLAMADYIYWRGLLRLQSECPRVIPYQQYV